MNRLLAVVACVALALAGASHAQTVNPSIPGHPILSPSTTTPRSMLQRLGDVDDTGFVHAYYLKDFGAQCDGTTDDSAAIQAWLNKAAPGVLLIAPAGTCVFKTAPLTIQAAGAGNIDNWGMIGAGEYATVFQYEGTSTTVDLFRIGSATANNLDTYVGVTITGFRIASTTTMTAGAGLHIWHVSRARVDPIIDGQDGTGQLFNGLWCDECDNVTIPYVGMAASNDALLVNGSRNTETWYPNYTGEIRLGKGKISNANGKTTLHAIHLAGGVGGFSCDAVDIIGATNNLLVDVSVSGTGNQTVIFGPACYLDTSVGDNVVFNDPNGPGSGLPYIGGNRMFEIDGSIATSGANGINIQNWYGGYLNIQSVQVSNATNDGIKYSDATANLLVGNGTSIRVNTNYGIESTVTSPKIKLTNVVFNSNTAGDFNANVLTSTLPIYTGQESCTAGLTFGGASVGLTYSIQKCSYVVNGFYVNMNYQLALSAVGSSTGGALLTGLPVAGSSARDGGGSAAAYMWPSSSLTSGVNLHVGANNTTADIYSFGASGQFALSNSNFTSTTTLEGTLLYLRAGAQ